MEQLKEHWKQKRMQQGKDIQERIFSLVELNPLYQDLYYNSQIAACMEEDIAVMRNPLATLSVKEKRILFWYFHQQFGSIVNNTTIPWREKIGTVFSMPDYPDVAISRQRIESRKMLASYIVLVRYHNFVPINLGWQDFPDLRPLSLKVEPSGHRDIALRLLSGTIAGGRRNIPL